MKFMLNKLFVVILAVLVEMAAAGILVYIFRDFFSVVAVLARILAVVIILYILYSSKHLSFDLLWILGIIFFPVVMTGLYLLIETDVFKSKTYRSIVAATDESKDYYENNDILAEMSELAPDIKGQFNYIVNDAGYPFYRSTGLDYYELGDTGYPKMLEDLKNAKEFIFIEYFIVEEGEMWNGMLDILEEKAAEGLDIRVMYDDLGSLTTLSKNYAKKLGAKGIKCIAFNKINPALGAIMNHRDHRKIMSIDGKVAYSGGVNLADEYINVKEKYGHWKDNIIRLEGRCVDSFTIMFLSHWNALNSEDSEFAPYINKTDEAKTGDDGVFDGYVAPYGETPFDDELTSQSVYMNILNQARDYCYIYTPYLIIDTEMINCLILAAKRGVDVRIMTPGIPDKKTVWKITRSFYPVLINGGVKIFEYTPGFVHSKVFVSDDRIATVGTINLDYRSLYLHFENGTYIFNSSKISDVKNDYLGSEAKAKQMSLDDCAGSLVSHLIMAVIRLFAPLL